MVELLVAATLSMLLLGLMVAFLVPALKGTSRGTMRSALQQSALGVVNHLARDLQATSPGGVSLRTIVAGSEPPQTRILTIHPLASVDASGLKIWETQLIMYVFRSEKRQVVRRLYGSGGAVSVPFGGASPLRLSSSTLDQLATTSDGSERLMASHVVRFYATGGPTDAEIASPLSIVVRTEEKEASQDAPITFELRRDVAFGR